MSILPRVDQEFKSLIPPLLEEEREQLEQNILSKRKCHDAIILWNGIIIDGHNRYEICMQHGIEFKVEELPLASREEAKIWVLANQLGRRNLTDAMRIEVALLKADMLRKKAQKKQKEAGGDKTNAKNDRALLSKTSKPENEKVHVQKALAAEAGVGEGTFHRYMQIKENGPPELQEQVKSGKLKIGTAHRLLTKEMLKQLSQADKMYKFIASIAPAENDQATNNHISQKLIHLSAQLQNLINKLTTIQSTEFNQERSRNDPA